LVGLDFGEHESEARRQLPPELVLFSSPDPRQQTGAVVSVRVEPSSVARNLGHEARVKKHE
jgi:hypothetical protein